jgi:hypothetical protein
MLPLNIKPIRCRKLISIKLDTDDAFRLKDHLEPLSEKKSILNRWVFQALANQMTLDLKAAIFFDSGTLSFNYHANISNDDSQVLDEHDTTGTYSLHLDFTGSNEFDLTLRSYLVQLYRDLEQFNKWCRYALINQMNMELAFRNINQDGGMNFEFARALSSASMDGRVSRMVVDGNPVEPFTPQPVNFKTQTTDLDCNSVNDEGVDIGADEQDGDTFELDSCLIGMIALEDDEYADEIP